MVTTRSKTKSKLDLNITKPTRASLKTSVQKAPIVQKPLRPFPHPIDPTIFQPPAHPSEPGLIQESLSHNLYFLCVQAILWNQTRGAQARPVLAQILTQYPDPAALARAAQPALTALLHPIGLHNMRAARLIAFAKAWVERPPCKARRYRRLGYPAKGGGLDVRPGEVLAEDDEREGWEVAHLPGIGAYALDSFRIFGRDKLRGREEEAIERGEEEWRRVVPLDKDLRRFLVWRWMKEGWEWNMLTGKKKRITRKGDDSSHAVFQ